MSKFLILIVLLNIYSCKCNFSGSKTFVKWENNTDKFVPTNIDIGSLEYSLNIESYKMKKNKLEIIASVYSNHKFKTTNESKKCFFIIGNNLQEKKLDTLSSFTNFKNEFSFDFKKYDYFVFIEKNEKIGTKYLIKNF